MARYIGDIKRDPSVKQLKIVNEITAHDKRGVKLMVESDAANGRWLIRQHGLLYPKSRTLVPLEPLEH